ncbi:phage tail tape measure protein [Paenibacillus lactis]
MTTVSSTLQMYDAMTRPLRNITNALNIVIRTMEQMNRATSRNHNIDRQLAAAKREIASAESQIAEAIEDSTRQQDRFNNSVRRGQRESGRLANTIKGIAASYLTFQGVQQLGGATIGGAMQQQEMVNTFSSRTGNEALGRAIYDQTVNQALKYGQDVDASLLGSMSFMSATMDPKQLTEINKLAMRLSKLNPTEGLEGAAFSLKELLSGDYTSISERFQISRSMLKDSEARLAGMRGDVDGFIKGMDKLLDQQNLTEEAFEKMLDSPAAKWNRAVQTFKFNLASAGEEGLQSLVPLFDKINEGFETGQFQDTFDMLSWAISGAVRTLLWFLETATQVFTFMRTNWPILGPVVYGVVGALSALALIMAVNRIAMIVGAVATGIQTAALFIQAAAVNGLRVAWAGLNTVMKANVFILLITSIIALAVWLYNLWKTNDQFAAGFMRAWNAILNFFDQVPLFFIRIGVGIENAFHDMKVNALKSLEGLVNGAIDRLNGLIAKLNKLKFVSIDFIDGVQFSAAAQIEAEAARQSGEARIAAAQQKAASKAAEREAKVQKFLADRAAKRAAEQAEAERKAKGAGKGGGGDYKVPASAMPAVASDKPNKKIDKVGKVGQVDKIKGKVDISSEDLKIMRDIAEMKNIQNFVTLTPTVNLKTGNINNSGDLDTIITKINTRLEEQVASSAKGVYDNG